MKRRTFLRGAITGGTLTMVPLSNLLMPAMAFPANRSNGAFQATTESEVLRNLFGVTSAIPNDAVKIEAPLQSTFGKDVPIRVRCNIDGVESIAIVTRNNRHPLNSVLRLQGAEPYYSTRIRVQRNSPIDVFVKTGDSVYFATAEIKFTHGGYGMHAK